MYEARQNKEKVSRRIEGGGIARQRVKIGDGRKVKDKPNLIIQLIYEDLKLSDSRNELKLGNKLECQNKPEILAHMAGEWNGNNNSAISGGHLLNEMKSKWGREQAGFTYNVNNTEGIYFKNKIPNINKATQNSYTFKIAKMVNGKLHISSEKESTFWPINWKKDALERVLDNSYKFIQANWYVCKENTNNTYWYKWNLEGKTMYPLGTMNIVESNRIKTKRGNKKVLEYINSHSVRPGG